MIAHAGKVYPCMTNGDQAQLTSAIYAGYLEDMASEPVPLARQIYRETRGFSSALRRNRISGSASVVVCPGALPYLELTGNTISHTSPPTLLTDYQFHGVLTVWAGSECGGEPWALDVQVADNRFPLPESTPEKATGVVSYCGSVAHFSGNDDFKVCPDEDCPPYATPVTVSYDHVGEVVNDCFPADGSILPVYGYARADDPEDYPSAQPYGPPQLAPGVIDGTVCLAHP